MPTRACVNAATVSVVHVIVSILGAPGSGKTTVTPILRSILPRHLIIDWDDLMEPASALAGCEIREDPTTWSAYAALVRSVLEAAASLDSVLLGVCTPEELRDWPIDTWLLMDCRDEVRTHRLSTHGRGPDIACALDDARSYRRLGLRVVDTSELSPCETGSELAKLISPLGAPH
jgi:hypothetical protein